MLVLTNTFLFILILRNGIADNMYCKESICVNDTHTLCQYGSPCWSQCPRGTRFLYFNDVQKEAILDEHNKIRNQVALGLDPYVGSVEVRRMRILSWSNEAEYIAGCLVRQCATMQDSCRSLLMRKKSRRPVPCEQNFYFQESYSDVHHVLHEKQILRNIVNHWYNKSMLLEQCGENNTKSCDFSSFDPDGKHASLKPFTRIIWQNTTQIGCSKIVYVKEGWNRYQALMVCNYCPGGNLEGKPVFELGNKSRNCGRFLNYKGLCGYQIYDDTFHLAAMSRFHFKEFVIIFTFGFIVLITM